MGCPSEVEIGDNLVFSVTTHAATGELTDADSVPAYRVYEDETATPILTGSMAKLDDANTLGFYTESIACTAGNGFENGKTYTIYITAAVGGTTGGKSYGFKAYDQRAADVEKIGGNQAAATALRDSNLAGLY
jgi:phenylacetate-coenzyme A ligase PaaK-like adenylate-forming protein